MKIGTITIFAIAIVCSPAAAQAAGIVITDAKIAAGKLTVQGSSPSANQTVELDGRFSVQSDASRAFTFSVVYVPADCIIQITAGASAKNAAVANCAAGQPRGADVTGNVSLSGVPNGRCTQVTLGVSGAKVGDASLISINDPVQNGMMFQTFRVSAADHVTANVCNLTGGAMTAINSMSVRIITFP